MIKAIDVLNMLRFKVEYKEQLICCVQLWLGLILIGLSLASVFLR